MARKRILAFLQLMLLVCSSYAQATYTNPVWNHDWPDPTVWTGDDGWFYCMATGGGGIIRSRDLAHWTDTGKRPFDEETSSRLHQYGKWLWAPDVTVVGGRRLAYVTMYNSSSDASIVVLKETSHNSFSFANVITRGIETKIEDTIDPEVVTDRKSGRVWLFFGSIGKIHRVELASDGLSVKDGAKYEHVAGLPASRDGSRLKVFEGSYLYRHGKYWYLFVSSGWYNNSTYRLSVGRSRSLEGKFVDREGRPMTEGYATPLLHSDDGDRFLGPGHCGEIFTDDEGNDFILYHCHDKNLENGRPRPMMLQQITWDRDGWPNIGDGKPAQSAACPVFRHRTDDRSGDEMEFAKWPVCAVGRKNTFCDGKLDDLMSRADGFSYCPESKMGIHFRDMKKNISDSERQWLTTAECEPDAFIKGSVWTEKDIVLYPQRSPSVSDANQTAIGDCNVISLFAEMAYLYPDFIKHIIRQKSHNSFAIKMFSPDGKSISVMVSNKVMCNQDGQILQVKGKHETATWTTILEKALMKYLQVYKGKSEDIGGFGAELMMPIFTGDGRSFSIRPGVLTATELKRMVTECLQHGLLVNGGFTKSDIPLDKHVTISGHGHTFMMPLSDNVLFRVRNPWGHGDDDHVMNVTDDSVVPPLIDLRIISPGIAGKYFRKDLCR